MNGRKHSARWLFGPAADHDDLTFDQKVNQMGDVRPIPAGLRPRVVPLIPMNDRRATAVSLASHLSGGDPARGARETGVASTQLEQTGSLTGLAGSMPSPADTELPRQGPVEGDGLLEHAREDARGSDLPGALKNSA